MSRCATDAPRPGIYWADLATSWGAGVALFALAVSRAPSDPVAWLATGGAVLAWLRAVVFVHEIAHRGKEVRGFETLWNLGVGIPMGVPSLLYVESHAGHHRPRAFGTGDDPEYAPLAQWSALRRALFVAAGALAPLALALRWGVLGPLAGLVPRLRRPVVERLSTLAINPGYRRRGPRGRERMRWRLQETAAAVWVWGVTLALAWGALPVRVVGHWLGVVGAVFVVNQLRTVMAHRYALDGRRVDARAQLLDSLTLPEHSLLAPLIAPLGLRYHALHHAAPGLPYHALGRVHRALIRGQPRDAPYARTATASLAEAWRSRAPAPERNPARAEADAAAWQRMWVRVGETRPPSVVRRRDHDVGQPREAGDGHPSPPEARLEPSRGRRDPSTPAPCHRAGLAPDAQRASRAETAQKSPRSSPTRNPTA